MTFAPDWVRDAVFYQIFPERFCNGDPSNDPPGVTPWGQTPTRTNFFGGDLAGVEQRLDYLQALGVNALYLNPVFTSPSNHKYDTSDYLAVDPHFGGTEALKRLVRRAHQLGIRVILDGVFNHTGDHFRAFEDVLRNGAESPYRDWYSFESLPVQLDPPNYRACGGASFLPKLNTMQPEVRDYLYRVAAHWLQEADIDGWRLDVPWEVPHEFWRGFRQAIKATRPDALLVGEAWGNAQPWLQGDQFDSVTHYPLRELVIRFILQQAIDATTFDRELNLLRSFYPGSVRQTMLTLVGSHDTPRIRTIAGGRTRHVRAAFAFLFTFEGVPMIYYGDEVGLEGGPDPDCRRCMPWDSSAWRQELLVLVTRLAHLRGDHPALRRGDFKALLCQERTYVYSRALDDDVVVVALNAGFQAEEVSFAVPTGAAGTWRDALTGERRHAERDGCLRLKVGALDFLILVPEA